MELSGNRKIILNIIGLQYRFVEFNNQNKELCYFTSMRYRETTINVKTGIKKEDEI